jgi:hypothetical protein
MQGVDEYVKYGSCFCKNKVCLTHSNIMEKATTFCKYNMKKKIGSTLLRVLFGDVKVWIVLSNNIMGFAIQK